MQPRRPPVRAGLLLQQTHSANGPSNRGRRRPQGPRWRLGPRLTFFPGLEAALKIGQTRDEDGSPSSPRWQRRVVVPRVTSPEATTAFSAMLLVGPPHIRLARPRRTGGAVRAAGESPFPPPSRARGWHSMAASLPPSATRGSVVPRNNWVANRD